MHDDRTYQGSCHCGRVRFEARAWNVSVKPGAFRLVSGKDDLGTYQFATRQGHHRSCRNCGVTAFGDGDVEDLGGAFVSIGDAAIADLTPEELERLPVRRMDGRHNNWMEPPKHGGYL